MISEATVQTTLQTALVDSGLFAAGSVGIDNLDTLLDQIGAISKAPYAVVRTADSFVVEKAFGENSLFPIYNGAFTAIVILAMAYSITDPLPSYRDLRAGVITALTTIDGSCCYTTRIEPLTDITPFERLGTDRTTPEFFGQALAVTVQD